MHSSEILEDQVIYLKRGRTNSFGWEPCWNAYFDFYLSSKYIDPPLLELEDVTFHLYLRKNLNDSNPSWRMPSYRQIKRKFRIGQKKIDAMLTRLDDAKLLKKVSGFRAGDEAENISNHFILSDPIPTLSEFLQVASDNLFSRPLKTEWSAVLTETTLYPKEVQGVPISDADPVPERGTQQQTLKTEQDGIWSAVLQFLQLSLSSESYQNYLRGSRLLKIEGECATVGLLRPEFIEWMQCQMAGKIAKLLTAEGGKEVESVTFTPL
jgi:hypothetical protein